MVAESGQGVSIASLHASHPNKESASRKKGAFGTKPETSPMFVLRSQHRFRNERIFGLRTSCQDLARLTNASLESLGLPIPSPCRSDWYSRPRWSEDDAASYIMGDSTSDPRRSSTVSNAVCVEGVTLRIVLAGDLLAVGLESLVAAASFMTPPSRLEGVVMLGSVSPGYFHVDAKVAPKLKNQSVKSKMTSDSLTISATKLSKGQ